jgi:uncharacterized lipoprotein YmbA
MKAALIRPWALLLLIAGLGSGCGILAPVPNPSHFFSLASLPQAQQARTQRDDAGDTTYALGPITLPAYLDREVLVTRVSPTQLRYSQVDYWAGSLKDNITSVLMQNLSALTGSYRILAYPWPNNARFDYQIAVEVLRFEKSASGDCQLTARWAIKDGRTQNDLIIRESQFTRAASASDTAAAVAALSATLGDLSEEIATSLHGLLKPASG